MFVVFDTTVFIPLILPGSRSTRLFLRLEAAGHRVVLSPKILAEVREKLLTEERVRKWLKLTEDDIRTFLDQLPKIAVVIPGLIEVQGEVAADPDDDMILAAALESGASYIVSEDRHLLDLVEWRGVKIMDRDSFASVLDRIESQSS